ncbi:hypothetical protein TI04_01940 [Achromatium sp. WMS2]|nr:hypothetical protein TI04_01940 [Achromatium sp. WMS2]
MLLFISILKTDQLLEIKLPPHHLPKDIIIISGTNSKERTQKILNQANPNDFGITLACQGQVECQGRDVDLLLPQSIYRDIAKITTLSMHTNSCRKLSFHIQANSTNNAVIDYQKLQTSNPCLLKIAGMRQWLQANIASAHALP